MTAPGFHPGGWRIRYASMITAAAAAKEAIALGVSFDLKRLPAARANPAKRAAPAVIRRAMRIRRSMAACSCHGFFSSRSAAAL